MAGGEPSSKNSRTQGYSTTLFSKKKSKKGEEEVDGDALEVRIKEVAAKLAVYARLPEDDAARLKTTSCMNAWYDLEEIVKTAVEYLREGMVRPHASIREAVKDSKSMLEEVSFRVKIYDLSMDCHGACFSTSAAKSDLQKYHRRTDLRRSIQALEKSLRVVPHRFKAARRDLQRSKKLLFDFESDWKDNLQERLSHRPRLIPEDFVRNCTRCDRSFSLILPKWHCFVCGRLFCGSCCETVSCLPKLVYYSPRWVCLECLPRHQHQEEGGAIIETLIKSVFPDLKDKFV